MNEAPWLNFLSQCQDTAVDDQLSKADTDRLAQLLYKALVSPYRHTHLKKLTVVERHWIHKRAAAIGVTCSKVRKQRKHLKLKTVALHKDWMWDFEKSMAMGPHKQVIKSVYQKQKKARVTNCDECGAQSSASKPFLFTWYGAGPLCEECMYADTDSE